MLVAFQSKSASVLIPSNVSLMEGNIVDEERSDHTNNMAKTVNKILGVINIYYNLLKIELLVNSNLNKNYYI